MNRAPLLFLSPSFSTYSWAIFVVRAALGLDSIPILLNRDMFLREPKLKMAQQVFKRFFLKMIYANVVDLVNKCLTLSNYFAYRRKLDFIVQFFS